MPVQFRPLLSHIFPHFAMFNIRFFASVSCFFLCISPLFAQTDWRSGIRWEEPPVVTPGQKIGDPPSDAIVLFDGKNTDAWSHNNWNGVMTIPGGGNLVTKEKFGSIQLHLEFAMPRPAKGNGQDRGNSGVYLMERYEVQILDSFENPTYVDGQCAGIYKQRPPYVNACRKPGEWQSYDIFFTRPVLKSMNNIVDVVRPATITVVHNGVLVVNNYALEGITDYNTPPFYSLHTDTPGEEMGRILLQDHGNPVKFRNIWVREIPDSNSKPSRSKEYFTDDPEIKNLKREIEQLKAELSKKPS